MADTNRINVRLTPDVRRRLDHFCLETHRNITQAVNLLLGSALAMVETLDDPEALFRAPRTPTGSDDAHH